MKIAFCLLFLVAVTVPRAPTVQAEHSLDVFKMYQLIQTMEDLFKNANHLTAGFSCENKSFQECYKSILSIYKTNIEGQILAVINDTVTTYLKNYKHAVLQYIHYTPPVADENYSTVDKMVANIQLKDSQLECVIGLLSVFQVPINDKLKELVFYTDEKQANSIVELREIVKANYHGEDLELHFQPTQFDFSVLSALKGQITEFSQKVCTTIQANWIKADLWVWRKVRGSYILAQNIGDTVNLLAWTDTIHSGDDEDTKTNAFNYEYLVDKPVLKVCQSPTPTPADKTAEASGSGPMQMDEDNVDGPDPRKQPGTSAGADQQQSPTMSIQCTLFNVQHQFVDLVLSLCGNQPYIHFKHTSVFVAPEQEASQAGQEQDETYESSYLRELSQTLLKVENSVVDETPVKLPNGMQATQTLSLNELFDRQTSYYNQIDQFHHEVASTIDRYVSKVIFSRVLRLAAIALFNYRGLAGALDERDTKLEKLFVEYFYLGQQLMVFKTVLELYISRGPVTLSDETVKHMNDILDYTITKYLYHVIKMNDSTTTIQEIREHMNDRRFYAKFENNDLGVPVEWQSQFDEIKQINMYVNELVEIKGQN